MIGKIAYWLAVVAVSVVVAAGVISLLIARDEAELETPRTAPTTTSPAR